MSSNIVDIIFRLTQEGKSAKELANEMKEVNETTKEGSKNLKDLADSGKFAALGIAIRKTAGYLRDAVKVSADYIEILNVLEVAFDGNTESIRRFATTLADTLNLDDSTIISAAAHFKVLTQSMGIATETGEKLAELMTKMTLDLSSLYNMDFSRAQTALQYAMEGRGTSLKQRTGVSVLETSVQTTMDVLGIDAYVEDMNDAEKAIARVITMEYQLMSSQGDLARTIEAPANQMRVMGEQVSLLARNIGNIFLPAVAAILPYLNAIFIVLNAIIGALAKLVGYKESMFDTFEEANTMEFFEGVGGAIDGVGDSAAKAAKKLQGLRGFDKLNVIKTPTEGSGRGGSGVGGAAGGINPDLLKAFNAMADQYNTHLENVKTKATQIAEAFFEWAKCLEVIKEPLANIAGLTYSGLIYVWENVLKPLGKWFADDLIPTAAKTIAKALDIIYEVGKKLFSIYKTIYENVILPFARSIGIAVVNSLDTISKILDFIAKSKFATTLLSGYVALKQFNGVAQLLLKTKMGKWFADVSKLILGDVKNIKSLNTVWKNFFTMVTPKMRAYKDGISKLKQPITTLKNSLSGLKTAALGAVAAFAGFEILKGSLQDISEKGLSVGHVLGVVAGTIVTVTGALTALNAITAIFGVTLSSLPFVGWIAGLTSVAVALGAIIISNNDFNSTSEYTKATIEEINTSYDSFNKKLNEVNDSYNNMLDSMNKNYEAKLTEIENGKAYIESLNDIVDGNFRVKEGYEDVADTILNELNSAYGTELTLENGIIKNNGQIINDKQQLITITDQYAEKIKKQTLLEGYQAMYKDAIEQQLKAKQEYNQVTDETNEKIEKTIKKLENNKIKADEADKILKEAKKKQNAAEEKYQKALGKTNGIIDGLNDVTKAYATGSAEELKKTIEGVTSTSKKSNEETKKALTSNIKALEGAITTAKQKQKKFANEIKNNANIQFELHLNTKQASKDFNRWGRTINNSSNGAFSIQYIPEYASGGLPQVGQMFIANERGAELVGNIGGQSFVANQNQVIDLIDKKLQNAGGLQDATFIIQVGDEQVAKKVLKDLNGMAKSNGKPITIRG